MKILQVTPYFMPEWEAGGVVRASYNLSSILAQRGHEVTVYTTSRNPNLINGGDNSPKIIEGMRVFYFDNFSRRWSLNWIPPIPYLLPAIARKEMKDFDIVHIHDFRTLLSIACHHYSALDKVPYVIQPHGSITPFFEKKKLKKIYDALWGSMILRDASRVISVSNKEAEQCKEMGVKSDRIRIIPNGIDFSRLLNREAVEGKSFREKNDIPDNAKVVLFLGRIHPAKRIELLIDAFSLLINEMNDLILLIVGPDGGGMQPLQEKIRNLGITDRVRFSDYVDNVGDVYLSADVLVNPPNTEIFGFVPFEALMCGTPIIVAKGSGTSEILSEANSGCVVDCKNASELKNTIRYVLEHPDESKELAEIGRRYVLRNFAFESVAERVEKVYEECLK